MAYPNRLSQFLKELRRRKVLKVLIWYAGVAIVLIGLADEKEAHFSDPRSIYKGSVAVLPFKDMSPKKDQQ